MEFFQDPSEIEDQIFCLKGYIDSGYWDEVELENKMYIRMIKNYLCKNQDKNYPSDFYLLSICENSGDILDTKRHLHGYDVKPFTQCLLSTYRIKILLWDTTSCDDLKRDFQKEADRLKVNLQMAWKVIDSVDAPIGKQTKINLKKGPYAGKSLKSLDACIIEILNEKGFDSKPKIIIDKIKTYTDDDPYQYKNFLLKFDPGLEPGKEKIYELNDKTGIDKSIWLHQIYNYIKDIKKKYK